jgi:hypothetical protein
MSTTNGFCISRRTIRIIQLLVAIGVAGVLAAEAPSLYRYAKIEAM